MLQEAPGSRWQSPRHQVWPQLPREGNFSSSSKYLEQYSLQILRMSQAAFPITSACFSAVRTLSCFQLELNGGTHSPRSLTSATQGPPGAPPGSPSSAPSLQFVVLCVSDGCLETSVCLMACNPCCRCHGTHWKWGHSQRGKTEALSPADPSWVPACDIYWLCDPDLES